MSEERYVTRREGVELVKQQLGIPLTKSVVDKDAHLGRGPKPAALYGHVHLYTPEEFLRYARNRITPVEAIT
jgi:hypothetical protein